jgi:ferredoxin-NADP reductase
LYPCCSNESLKAIKEAAKQQEWASDKAIMEEYAAQMEKQEAARRAQVGRGQQGRIKQADRQAGCVNVILPQW